MNRFIYSIKFPPPKNLNLFLNTFLYTGCIAGCDFDEEDFCGWTNVVPDEIFGWEFWNGQTDTPGTGPDDDFSKPGCEDVIKTAVTLISAFRHILSTFLFFMQWGCTC